jgi:hypothetical protein
VPAWDGAGERTPPACGCSWPERCKQSALRWQAGRGRRTQVWASAGRLEARQTALRAAKTQNPRGETRWHCPRSWLCRPTATSVRPQTRWASPVSASRCVAAADVVHRAEPATADPPHRDACAWTGCLIGLLLLHAASCLRAASSCNANRHGGPELEPVSSGPVSPVGDPGASICASLSRDRVLQAPAARCQCAYPRRSGMFTGRRHKSTDRDGAATARRSPAAVPRRQARASCVDCQQTPKTLKGSSRFLECTSPRCNMSVRSLAGLACCHCHLVLH